MIFRQFLFDADGWDADARIVDENVELAKSFRARLHRRRPLLGVRDVERCPACRVSEPLDDRLPLRFEDVRDQDPRTFPYEKFGDCFTLSASSAGHEGDLAGQPIR